MKKKKKRNKYFDLGLLPNGYEYNSGESEEEMEDGGNDLATELYHLTKENLIMMEFSKEAEKKSDRSLLMKNHIRKLRKKMSKMKKGSDEQKQMEKEIKKLETTANDLFQQYKDERF